MNNIYTDGSYLKNNATWHAEDSPWKASSIVKILDRNDIKFETLIEIGCGAGEILVELSKVYPDVSMSGYEISPQAFDVCKTKATERVAFKLENAFKNSDIFDVAIAADVFEHVDDYIGFLRLFKKKGTYKVFHIPLDLSVQTLLRMSPIMNTRRNVGHLHYFTKETALATLETAGYKVLDHFYTAGAVDLPSKSIKTAIAKFPRKLAFNIHQDFAVRILGGYSLLVLTE